MKDCKIALTHRRFKVSVRFGFSALTLPAAGGGQPEPPRPCEVFGRCPADDQTVALIFSRQELPGQRAGLEPRRRSPDGRSATAADDHRIFIGRGRYLEAWENKRSVLVLFLERLVNGLSDRRAKNVLMANHCRRRRAIVLSLLLLCFHTGVWSILSY